MSLESEVSELKTATNNLLSAVSIQKSYLDAAAASAIAGVTAQGAIVPTPAKSPLGNAQGVFSPDWIDQAIPFQRSGPIGAGGTTKVGFKYLQQGGAAQFIYIGYIPAENLGSHENLLVTGVFSDNWQGITTTPFRIMVVTRGGLKVEWSTDGLVTASSRFLIYRQESGQHNIYAYLAAGSYSSIAFDLSGMDAPTLITPTISDSTPSGEIVFDSAQPPGTPGYIPPRYTGVLGINYGSATMFSDSLGAKAFHSGPGAFDGTNQIANNSQTEGAVNLTVLNSVRFYTQLGNFGNLSSCSMGVTTSAITGRSINAGGSVNTQGNDYAEYVTKSEGCSSLAKGQIIGLTEQDKLTDKWENSVVFLIKSTSPSFVGGDTWASKISEPTPNTGKFPIPPTRFIGSAASEADTDEQWTAKQTAYAEALEKYKQGVESYEVRKQEFEAALEVERQKVDRVAIAGRVPVNVYNAAPGDYIIPEQDGEGIKGVAIPEADITFAQYRKAVGQVIKILEDGRAYVMVKVV